MATETVPAIPLEQLAGAELFDQVAKRIGEVSAASFDRHDIEDHDAMVNVLRGAIAELMTRGADFSFGFLLPIVDMIDCHRLRLVPNAEWSGVVALLERARQGADGAVRPAPSQALGNASEVAHG